MGDAVVPLEDPDALEFDLRGIEALEQTAPLAEEHRDEMDLELVEEAGRERELRDRAAPWTSTSFSPAAFLASLIAVLTSST